MVNEILKKKIVVPITDEIAVLVSELAPYLKGGTRNFDYFYYFTYMVNTVLSTGVNVPATETSCRVALNMFGVPLDHVLIIEQKLTVMVIDRLDPVYEFIDYCNNIGKRFSYQVTIHPTHHTITVDFTLQ